MPVYLSPGVYVEEVSSGSAPIAGVGTSVAAFIGILSLSTTISESITVDISDTGDFPKKHFQLTIPSNISSSGKLSWVKGTNNAVLTVTPPTTPTTTTTTTPTPAAPTIDYQLTVDEKGLVYVDFNSDIAKNSKIAGSFDLTVTVPSVLESEIKLVTNFTEFKQFFGDFSIKSDQNTLAHAVYGFFRNGGTRAYVTWISEATKLDDVLEALAAIDEISIIAAPGQTDPKVVSALKDHAATLGDRIVILDSPPDINLGSQTSPTLPAFTSSYAAFYFPWIQVYDPASDQNIYVPPSGHLAGIYARVDAERGVHKAPANVPILGALDLQYNLSKAKQDGLNPKGVNVIRKLNGNLLVWGARTLGGDANGEFKYINIRRHFSYLRDSIDKGTQWVVFEPNTPELWAKIRRNIAAFLTLEWRKGALFGTTVQEAFYVKCDEETNPPALRDLGQVVTEIGVAVVNPAEFVIFRLSQWAGPKG